MGTEDLTVVATPEEATPQGKTYEENPYGIYDYLKEHTAFLVACVSALVAVISFLLNYAASLYTGAYLRYWMIDTVYAKENNTELVYMILFTLLYTGVMIITHKVMSGTANVFGFYNRILSALKWYYKEAKSNTCAIKRKTKELVRTNKRLAKKLPKTESDQLFKENERLQQEAETLEKSLKEIGSMKCACGLWLFLNVCGSALIMFGIIFVVVGFMTASRGDYRAIGPAVLAGIVVLFDLLIYFFLHIVLVESKRRTTKRYPYRN